LETAGVNLLVGTDANMIHSNNVNHLLQAIDVFLKAREEVSDTDRAKTPP
jgi:hypothetical protein